MQRRKRPILHKSAIDFTWYAYRDRPNQFHSGQLGDHWSPVAHIAFTDSQLPTTPTVLATAFARRCIGPSQIQ
jgi:hypothetical protein